jgi:hypothetical protein
MELRAGACNTMTIRDKIDKLTPCELPKRYGWKDRGGIDLKELGFIYTSDCLNKKYTRECDPFPPDFDSMLLYRILGGHLKYKWQHAFIDVDPERLILGQRYVKRSRLLSLLEEPNVEPIRGVQIGRHIIIHDGHHRLALKRLRNSKVYARIKVYHYDD